MVRVRAEEDKSIDAEKHIDEMAMKYMGRDKYPRSTPGEKRVVFRIKPEHVFKLT